MSSDYAGGGHIAHTAIAMTYSYHYRCGPYSSFIPEVMELLGADDKSMIFDKMLDDALVYSRLKEINKAVDKSASEGDAEAQKLLDETGIVIADSTAGCIKNLNFEGEILIVLAGSIWHRLSYGGVVQSYKERLKEHTDKKLEFILFDSPPAVGAILWALEIYNKKPVDTSTREKILNFMTKEKYESLVQ